MMSEPSVPVEILLVDDREENLIALESALECEEYKLVRASSGDDALRHLLDHKPALILMDVQMPRLDGYETATIIKGSERTQDIPIIFLTALTRDERFVLKGYETGGVDYISKPIDIEILRSKVRVFADLHRKNQAALIAERQLRNAENLEREKKMAMLELRSLKREQQQQKRYHDLVEGIHHGIVWSANLETMTFSYVGPTAERLLGFSRQQWFGEPSFWQNHIFPEDAPAFSAARACAIAEGRPMELEHRFVTADGRVVWLHTGIRVSEPQDGQSKELQGLSTDITRNKEAELLLKISKKRSDLLARSSLILGHSFDVEAMLAELGRVLNSEYGDWFSVDVLSNAELKNICLSTPTAPSSDIEKFRKVTIPLNSETDFAYTFETGKPIVYHDVTSKALERLSGSEPRRRLMKNLKSAILVPISVRGLTLGVAMIGSTTAINAFEREDVEFLGGLASRIAAALEMARLYDEAKVAINLRDEFLSIASHELRTPLTPLKLQIQRVLQLLVKDQVKKGDLSRLLGTSEKHITRLTKLIEDLLDVSRIGQGKLQLELQEFSLEDLIHDVIQRFSRQFEDVGCTVDLDMESNLNVNWDYFRIEQVLVNLLTNATKFAPKAPIHIRAFRNGNNVAFSVRDEGPGIALEDQKRIFKRFERAESKTHIGGLGLGLYIVSQILELHEGSIRVVSGEKGGSEFLVEIPQQGPSLPPEPLMTAQLTHVGE
jgi:PAS domain S-box-containing protein